MPPKSPLQRHTQTSPHNSKTQSPKQPNADSRPTLLSPQNHHTKSITPINNSKNTTFNQTILHTAYYPLLQASNPLKPTKHLKLSFKPPYKINNSYPIHLTHRQSQSKNTSIYSIKQIHLFQKRLSYTRSPKPKIHPSTNSKSTSQPYHQNGLLVYPQSINRLINYIISYRKI